MNKNIITTIEGIPDKFLKDKKIILTNGQVLIADIKTSETFSFEEFLTKHRQEIRNYKIELILS
ncbi:MAG: hypothetical protein IT246_10605 [Bacteroidia bacterium]|nr:hypothetical protein [Bacteroidia bacterium]